MPSPQSYMQRCIDLAVLGAGKVSPNPMVGAVIVCRGQIIGEGYHEGYGQNHAEVNAINEVLKNHVNAIELLKQSTIYVNLEPCSHFGKTPPCADLIISHAILNVVVGCRDPFEKVDGKGMDKLQKAGIMVTEGILKNECEQLNKRFFTRVKKQRPYIILKWAQTTDGFFAPANGSQRWISSNVSKKLTHKWRSGEDAVLVGKNTALVDNPRLNVRDWTGKNPTRIVIDRNLELPEHLNLFDQSQQTIVFNALKTGVKGKTKYLELEDFDNLLPQLIAYQLYLMDVQSLIIEGGAQTLNLFIKAGLWDEARVFTGVDYWGEGIKAPMLTAHPDKEEKTGPDILHTWYNR